MITALTLGKALALLSAAAGAIGTGLLFKGSFAVETLGGFYADQALIEGISRRNRRRQLLRARGCCS